MFYLDEPVPVNKDDVLKGKIAVKRNKQNPRDLDIHFTTTPEGKTSAAGKTQSKDYRLR